MKCELQTKMLTFAFSPQKRSLSMPMCSSTHLSPHLMVCLDWMELLFQLNVITKSMPMHMNRGLQCAVEICVKSVCFQEVFSRWRFPASHLGSTCCDSFSRRPDRLSSASHDRYYKDDKHETLFCYC